jgi:hypothetical protein
MSTATKFNKIYTNSIQNNNHTIYKQIHDFVYTYLLKEIEKDIKTNWAIRFTYYWPDKIKGIPLSLPIQKYLIHLLEKEGLTVNQDPSTYIIISGWTDIQ